MANAGATGVVLDILCQAPRHHTAWKALSTAGAGLLAALVRCEGGTEAAQPQALQMLLAMLQSDLTCGPARQAVATVLHCLVAQRTVHRDKLLAAGAVPVLLRMLRRLDVLCDLVAVQELLWTLVYLTDEGTMSLASGGLDGADGSQPLVAERLVPLLFLYAMPWHPQHGHLAALATRALHVHVAGYDAGKDTLRGAGMLSVLVDSVRRHSAPYVAAAKAAAQQGRSRSGVLRPTASANGPMAAAAAGKQVPGGTGVGGGAAGAAGLVPAARGSYLVRSTRPLPHEACDVHADGDALPNGAAEKGPYTRGTAAALWGWTPWQRLLAVLLIAGIVPGVVAAPRQPGSRAKAGAAAGELPGGSAWDGAGREGGPPDEEEPSTPSTLRSSEGSVRDDGDDVWGGRQSKICAAPQAPGEAGETSQRWVHYPHNQQPPGGADAAAADGARMVCYGLLLPLLVDAGEEAHAGGAGAAAAAVGGALLRRRLCPLRESLATLKTLLCDCEANQLEVAGQGLPELLVQLVAHGDMGLAWQAAEAAVYLSGGATGAALVAAGAAEEMAYLLEESADLLHGLTLRKQIRAQKDSMAHSDSHRSHPPHSVGPGGAHAHQRQPSPQPPLPTRTVSGSAAAAPAAFTDVHVRPTRTAAGCYGGGRPQRMYLVGRIPLDFTTSGSCFYGSHDPASYCDYCTPSAAIKVLLRLMAAAPAAAPPPLPAAGCCAGVQVPGGSPVAVAAAAGDAVCRRLAAAGGMYSVLLLLHHEAAGVHHSKLAASLLTLLDLLLLHAPGAQDEVRLAGGLGVLTTLLGSLMRPGVMDVYQLRVATCRTLQLALQGNAANKLAAREQGLMPLLVALLAVLAQQRKSRSSEVVVDDSGPLTTAALEALAAAAHESPGTQDALVALGLLHPLCDLLRDERLDVEVRTAAVRTLTAVVEQHPAGQAGALALGAVPPVVAWLERCCQDAVVEGQPAAGGGPAGGLTELAEAAEALAALLGALVRGGDGGGGNPNARSAVVSAGALAGLLHLLRSQDLASAAAAATSEAAASAAPAAADPTGSVTGLAASVLAVLIEGDTDLQNELVSQGGLMAAVDVVRAGGVAAPAALRLMSAMLRSNTFVKNTARQAGLPAMLVATVRRCGLVENANAAAAAAALAELAAGNHANQEAVAVQGGLEVAVELMRDAFAALPLRVLTGGGGAAAADAGGHEGKDVASTSVAAAAADLATVSYSAAEAAEDAAAAASLSRLLRALLGLMCTCVELNGGNKAYVRELGGVSLLGGLLLATAEVLTAPPALTWLALAHSHRQGGQGEEDGHGEAALRLRDAAAAARAAVFPAVAAACGALVAVTRESSANLARLEEQPRLAVALFKLLVAADASTSLAAALAIEWLVVRSRAHLDAPSREAFELNLVDVLVLALYVPYAPLPLAPPPPSGGAVAASHAAWVAAQKRQQPRHGPWYAEVRALMPADGLAAAAVRDAAAILTVVADAADTFDAQRRQQLAQPGQVTTPAKMAVKPSLVTTSRGSLPPLEAAPIEPVALDHNTGLMVSNLLAGPSAAADAGGGSAAEASDVGPGSQTWWAEFAGSAAAAFQRVANGALYGTPAAAGGAAAAAPAGPGASLRAAAAPAPPAPAGLQGAMSETAQGRRRQVAWMLFLLAAKSHENRARIRWLVRASLFPLAQQLANAELCRAQLEAAGAAPLASASGAASSSGPRSGWAAGAAGGGVQGASSAALESASSLQGPLPVSTAALEELSGGLRRSSSPVGTTPHHRQEGQYQQQALQNQQQHHPPVSGPSPHAPLPPAPPRANSRPSSASSASSSMHPGGPPQPVGQPRPASTGAGGAGLLYGSLHGGAPAATPASSSVPATPRESYLEPNRAAGDGAAAAGLSYERMSCTASGGGPVPPPGGDAAAAAATAVQTRAGGAASISASSTPRVSLTGSVAVAFASTAPARVTLTGNPSPSRMGVLYGASPAEAIAAAAAAAPRPLPQISGGGSSVMSDDDELAMIQQEVALLANTTNALAWSGGVPGGAAGGRGGGSGGYRSGGTGGSSPAGSPARWGAGRR